MTSSTIAFTTQQKAGIENTKVSLLLLTERRIPIIGAFSPFTSIEQFRDYLQNNDKRMFFTSPIKSTLLSLRTD